MDSRDVADPVSAALRLSTRSLVNVGLFSGFINLLMLSGPFYMLQVYDRVIPSRNVATLMILSASVLAIYAVQCYFDALRGRMLSRIGALFDARLQRHIHVALATLPLRGAKPALVQQPLRDLEQVRAFLSGVGPTAFLDMPWIPLFIGVLFLFHPAIGAVAVAGAGAVVSLALLTERRTRRAAVRSLDAAAQRQSLADATRQNAEAIRALGMTGRLTARWARANERHLADGLDTLDVQANLGAAAKAMRFALQSAMLGTAAYLVVAEQASGGIMIASSIMMGRALAPIEIALGSWKQMAQARQSVGRLRAVLRSTAPSAAPKPALSRPERRLTVEDLSVEAPGTGRVLVSGVSFTLDAGTGLAILGQSASGKSTLTKAMVGIWPGADGSVRLDGAALEQWDGEDLGRYVGYLPQDVGLLAGTVAENIARFRDDARPEAVVEAARTAGAHELIVGLPDGYATRIGEGGAGLSAGQRQRIGLARAAFGDPFLVVLDEPNANLDAEGEDALGAAILALRRRGCAVAVVSHRPSALACLDMALVMHAGRAVAFGPRDAVFARAAAAAARPEGERPAAPIHREEVPA